MLFSRFRSSSVIFITASIQSGAALNVPSRDGLIFHPCSRRGVQISWFALNLLSLVVFGLPIGSQYWLISFYYLLFCFSTKPGASVSTSEAGEGRPPLANLSILDQAPKYIPEFSSECGVVHL
ncbi:hypothetical protein F5884DRAFT_441578 [Xylogone sp. PMI_703]|nr:hypothetical protein F5884DRAFT_441578 [Xylogone sp. PMI_703]